MLHCRIAYHAITDGATDLNCALLRFAPAVVAIVRQPEPTLSPVCVGLACLDTRNTDKLETPCARLPIRATCPASREDASDVMAMPRRNFQLVSPVRVNERVRHRTSRAASAEKGSTVLRARLCSKCLLTGNVKLSANSVKICHQSCKVISALLPHCMSDSSKANLAALRNLQTQHFAESSGR